MKHTKNIKLNEKLNLYLLGVKGYECLKYIKENDYVKHLNYVIIGKDKNIEDDYSEKIQKLCQASNIDFDYRGGTYLDIEKNIASIAISWKWLINSNAPIIVLHDSILPKYRGFLPLVSQLLDCQKEIGVTAFLANQNYDEGDIIHISKVKIDYPIKINSAIQKINYCYLKCIEFIFNNIENKNYIPLKPQDDKNASYSLWRDDDDYFVNWNWSAEKIRRFVDSVGYPYKGAKTLLNQKEITIHHVNIIPNVKIMNREVGKFFKIEEGKPIIVCNDGLIKIEAAEYRDTKNSILPLNSLKQRFANKF